MDMIVHKRFWCIDYVTDVVLRAVAGAGAASWKDVEHWMWPLFANRWQAVRTQLLGLPAKPFVGGADGTPLEHAPSTPILYGERAVLTALVCVQTSLYVCIIPGTIMP